MYEHRVGLALAHAISSQTTIPSTIETEIRRGDSKCFLSGWAPLPGQNTGSLEVSWIYHPDLAAEVHLFTSSEIDLSLNFIKCHHHTFYKFDLNYYVNSQNCILIRKELARAFLDNSIGVDVDVSVYLH